MPRKTYVQTTINGENVEFLCEPRQSLLECLRDVIGLTGSKEGCNDGNCGACTVNLDGRIVTSCLVLGVEAEGRTSRPSRASPTATTSTPYNRPSSKMPPFSAASAPPVSSWRPRRCSNGNPTPQRTASASGSPTTSVAARATTRSSEPYSTPLRRCRRPRVDNQAGHRLQRRPS